MDLCLVLSPDDTLDSTDNTILNHAHQALVGDDESFEAFKKLAANTKRYVVQSLVRQHCNLTGEDFAIIDLPDDVSKEFVLGLIGAKPAKKGATKRSDTPEVTPVKEDFRDVRSETDADTVYRVTIEGGKATKCECMGFRYYKTCKHKEKVQKELDAY